MDEENHVDVGKDDFWYSLLDEDQTLRSKSWLVSTYKPKMIDHIKLLVPQVAVQISISIAAPFKRVIS